MLLEDGSAVRAAALGGVWLSNDIKTSDTTPD